MVHTEIHFIHRTLTVRIDVPGFTVMLRSCGHCREPPTQRGARKGGPGPLLNAASESLVKVGCPNTNHYPISIRLTCPITNQERTEFCELFDSRKFRVLMWLVLG